MRLLAPATLLFAKCHPHLHAYVSSFPPLIGKRMYFPSPRRASFETLRKITISSSNRTVHTQGSKTMAEDLQPYSVQRFNAILDLADVRDAVATNDGEAFINSVFIPLVRKHSLEEKVGLGLLHHHFDLEDGEKLVELHSMSTPWSVDIDEIPFQLVERYCQQAGLSKMANSCHMGFTSLHSMAVPPFKSVDLTDLSIHGFRKEFVYDVEIANLDCNVSLRPHPEGDFDKTLEITQPRANVNLSKGQVVSNALSQTLMDGILHGHPQ